MILQKELFVYNSLIYTFRQKKYVKTYITMKKQLKLTTVIAII